MATLTTTINYSEPAGSIIASLGTPGPAGPGVPPGGSANQILAKIDGVSYNTEWVNPQDIAAVWGQISGNIANQSDLQSALASKLDSSTAASTYLPLAGGYITGDIQSNTGASYRTWNGANLTAALLPNQLQFNDSNPGGGSTTLDVGGITFASSPYKQTTPFLGLAGYATESWVTTQLGSYLTISSASATYYPLTNPAGYITLSALSGYATESWVTSQGYLTSASLSGYATESWVTGQGYITATTAAATYYPLTNPSGFIADAPADGTTYGRKDGVWSAVVSSVAWGSITGDIVNQLDLQGALDAKYDASNPAGFITSASLAGYATESWVTSQGYLTTAYLDGYAQLAGSIFTGEISFSASSTGRLVIDSFYESGGDTYPRFTFGTGSGTPSAISNGDFWFNGTYLQYGQGGIKTVASQSWVTSQGYITSSALTPYALLSGATFTGKVNLATIGVGTPSVNLGGQCDSAPASATNGDLWISNAVAPKLTYRMGGINYNLPVLNQFNTFTNQMVIDTASATTAALRVTQRGAGNAIEVEDSTTPDATRFVVDQFGKVGIGVAPDATAAIKIDGNGMSFNGLVFNPTATAAHTGGTDTLDLLVTINGTAYRIGLRPA